MIPGQVVLGHSFAVLFQDALGKGLGGPTSFPEPSFDGRVTVGPGAEGDLPWRESLTA
jgi:hypothetical protein